MKTRTARLSAGIVSLALLLGACSDDGDDASNDENVESTTTAASEDEMSEDTSAEDEMSEDAAAEADIVDTAVEAGDFTTLVAAVQAAGLEDTLRGDGPFTVFAPSDAAFEALPEGTVEGLLEEPEGALTDILTYHVVEGEVMAADVAGMDGEEVTTVNGATFTVGVGEDGSVTLTDAAGNEVGVTTTDVAASNGVIHVIDGVLMPS